MPLMAIVLVFGRCHHKTRLTMTCQYLRCKTCLVILLLMLLGLHRPLFISLHSFILGFYAYSVIVLSTPSSRLLIEYSNHWIHWFRLSVNNWVTWSQNWVIIDLIFDWDLYISDWETQWLSEWLYSEWFESLESRSQYWVVWVNIWSLHIESITLKNRSIEALEWSGS